MIETHYLRLLNGIYVLVFLFRVSPLFLISYFVFSSLFNADVRSMVFLSLLMANCLIVILINRALESYSIFNRPYNQAQLASMMFGAIPLGFEVYAYTIGYFYALFYDNAMLFNTKHQNFKSVGLIFTVLGSMVIMHFADLLAFQGVNAIALALGLALGIGLGAVAYRLTREDSLRMFTNITGTEVCRRASKQSFKCRPKYVM